MGILDFLKRNKDDDLPDFDEPMPGFDQPASLGAEPTTFPTPQPEGVVKPTPPPPPASTKEFHDKNLEVVISKLDVIKEKLEKIEHRVELIERYMYGSR
jgi:hypothetical protein